MKTIESVVNRLKNGPYAVWTFMVPAICSVFLQYACAFGNVSQKSHSSNTCCKDSLFIWSPNTRLKMIDFMGEVKSNQGVIAAESAISVRYDFSILDSLLVVDVYAVFNRCKSWSFDTDDNRVLNHEQRHFDIAELTCRMIRKDLMQNYYENGTLNQQWTLTRTAVGFYHGNFMKDEQKYYDQETAHGTNFAEQEKFDKWIDSTMNEYKDYASPRIYLPISDTIW